MQLHDLLAQGQTEPGTALLAPDLHERFKDPSLLAVGNAFAIVFNADDHPIAMTSGLQTYAPA
ncbi:hypothetical protein D3C80_2080560 [compost metagenome]